MQETILRRFQRDARFTHPDWKGIAADLAPLDKSRRGAEMLVLCREWMLRNRNVLGGDHWMYESPGFLFISPLSKGKAADTAAFLDRAARAIVGTLPEIMVRPEVPKLVVMMFAALDDYYAYISHFYGEGYPPMSDGVCILQGGLPHVALPIIHEENYKTVVVHELTHLHLTHIQLPVWLEEALAMRMEEMICGTTRELGTWDAFDRHKAWWTAARIQDFWQGWNWVEANEGFGLGYQLAAAVWKRIETGLNPSREVIQRFIAAASPDAAGEAAGLEILGVSLGEMATDFLGKGEWRPRPELWRPLERENGSGRTGRR